MSNESPGPVGGSVVRHFANGSLFWSQHTGVRALRGAIRAHWFTLSNAGQQALGLPVADETPHLTASRISRFSRGAIMWHPLWGSREIHGAIAARYLSDPDLQTRLGAATSDEIDFAGGRANRFVFGALFWTERSGVDPIIASATTAPPAAVSGPFFGTAEVLVERGHGWLPQYLRFINFSGDGGPASSARINKATTIAADGSGGYYFADTGNQRIRHVDGRGVIRTVVGNGQATATAGPHCAWDRPALETCLNWVHGVSLDTDGGILITDSFNHVVTKLDRNGIVRRLAGTGARCLPAASPCGEGGSALSATLDRPTTSRRIGNTLYIADSSDRILAVGPDGIMRRVVGTGESGFSGDEGPANRAKIWGPADMIGYRGGLLVSDGNNCRLRWVDPQGIIHAFAGYGGDIQWCWRNYGDAKYDRPGAPDNWASDGPMHGDVGDSGPALWARLSVTGFLADVAGEVCVTDFLNYRVRCIDARGLIRTATGGVYAATEASPLTSDGVDGPLPAGTYPLGWASGIAYDEASQRLLVSDGRVIGIDIPLRYVVSP